VADNQALIPITDDTTLGPAMLALPNDRQRAFVVALVQLGCDATHAAAVAGYALEKSNGHAWRLAHDPKIQAALLEECKKVIRSDAPMALTVLRTVAKDPTAPHRDRLRAATEILNRSGLNAVSETNITVTHKSEAEQDREILALASELGLDDKAKSKLLGRPVVTEAQFEIIDEPTDIAPPRAPSGAKISNPERSAEERAADRMRKKAQRNETPEERDTRLARVREEQRERAKRIYEEAQVDRRAVVGLEDLLDLPETGIEGTPKNE
jgi:phage terminase small subunit